jgi:hypothetical protein
LEDLVVLFLFFSLALDPFPLFKQYAWAFSEKVDPNKLGLKDYHQIVKKPMDLGTIKKNLEEETYANAMEFFRDMDLVWSNTFKYNKKGSQICQYAEELSTEFNALVKNVMEGEQKKKKKKRKRKRKRHRCPFLRSTECTQQQQKMKRKKRGISI